MYIYYQDQTSTKYFKKSKDIGKVRILRGTHSFKVHIKFLSLNVGFRTLF